jgi:hypothetical protein
MNIVYILIMFLMLFAMKSFALEAYTFAEVIQNRNL